MKKFLFIFIFCIIFSQLLFSQLKPGQLRVDGKYLKDGSGNTVRLIGINHAHAWYRGHLSSALQGIRSWGANSVRVVLANGYKWTKIPASEVSTIISQARSYGFKAIVLEVHDTTGYGDDSSACTLDRAVDYWIEIKSVLDGQEDFVIINIGNEPIGNNSSYVSQWANWTKSAIQRLRNNGFTHVIMVDAPNWGQDWTNTMRNNASDVLNADSLKNTIFSIHMYGVYNTASKVQSYISYFYNNNLPLCIGEFGNYHTDGDPDEQAIVQYARQYGYSIFGWSWCGNGGGVEYLDMVYNWDANSPTNWGSWFKANALSDVQTYYTLTVNVSPQGSGSVSLNPPGGSYTAGTQVTLTATANSGYVFGGWGGDLSGSQNPATIVMDSSKTVTANFVRSSYTLTVNINPSGAGSVTLNPSGGVYVAGTTVTLTAVANSGYIFSGWGGDLSGDQNPVNIVMDSNKNVIVNFIEISSGVVGGTTGYIMIDISSRVISGVVGIVVRLEGYNVSEVGKVRLYLNGILIGEDVDGLDGYVFSLDSRGYGDGMYILKVEVVGLGGVVLGERDEEVEIKNVVGGGNGEGGGSGGSGGVGGEVSGGEINSKTNKLYINLTNKQTETIVVDKTEVEWIKVYDLKGKLIDSYDGNTLDVKRYKVGSYIFELKLKDGRTKYGTMVVVK
jgi:mannan endo-1,4-beta-mannosidase